MSVPSHLNTPSNLSNRRQVEWIGYIFRILAHYNMHSMAINIVQTLLLLLPPSLFAASIYMVLGRLILYANGESMAPIRANWLTKIFVIGDVFTFFVQAVGKSRSFFLFIDYPVLLLIIYLVLLV